ncbi:MAG: 30S ribosomal protein S9 [Fibrobacterota bacterium]
MSEVLNATGRRKSSSASVYLTPGSGKRVINGKDAKAYLCTDNFLQKVELPFELLECGDKYDLKVNVKGGGISGQAEAIKLGVARCLASLSQENRDALKKEGFMTRDARVKERKKYGQAGARKQFQFSKR